jgi:hypothetical protein
MDYLDPIVGIVLKLVGDSRILFKATNQVKPGDRTPTRFTSFGARVRNLPTRAAGKGIFMHFNRGGGLANSRPIELKKA